MLLNFEDPLSINHIDARLRRSKLPRAILDQCIIFILHSLSPVWRAKSFSVGERYRLSGAKRHHLGQKTTLGRIIYDDILAKIFDLGDVVV
jgi:hypothetical protein